MATKKTEDKTTKNPIRLGNNVFILTVSHYYTGKIVELDDKEIVIDDAAWIANTLRFHDTLVKGDFDEIEPFTCPVAVNRGAIVAVTDWPHPLPRTQK